MDPPKPASMTIRVSDAGGPCDHETIAGAVQWLLFRAPQMDFKPPKFAGIARPWIGYCGNIMVTAPAEARLGFEDDATIGAQFSLLVDEDCCGSAAAIRGALASQQRFHWQLRVSSCAPDGNPRRLEPAEAQKLFDGLDAAKLNTIYDQETRLFRETKYFACRFNGGDLGETSATAAAAHVLKNAPHFALRLPHFLDEFSPWVAGSPGKVRVCWTSDRTLNFALRVDERCIRTPGDIELALHTGQFQWAAEMREGGICGTGVISSADAHGVFARLDRGDFQSVWAQFVGK